MSEKKSFLMYTSYLDNVEILSNEEAGQLLKAIYAFVNGNELPELDRVVQLTFNPIKSHLERDKEKYKEICRKRSESGAKGGRPKKQMVSDESKCFFKKAKKADNENENENENVNENVNDNADENADNNDNFLFYESALTQTQYAALCDKYGKNKTDRYIGIILKYKYVNPERYSDCYSVLNDWMSKGLFSCD